LVRLNRVYVSTPGKLEALSSQIKSAHRNFFFGRFVDANKIKPFHQIWNIEMIRHIVVDVDLAGERRGWNMRAWKFSPVEVVWDNN
jgi:hypothetical protein